MKFMYRLIIVSLSLIALASWVSGVIPGSSGRPHGPLWMALGETEIRGGAICYVDTEWDGFCPANTGICENYLCYEETPGGDYECETPSADLMVSGAWRDDCVGMHTGSRDCGIDFVGCGSQATCYKKPCNGPLQNGTYVCMTKATSPLIMIDRFPEGGDCP
jgi:hypothetical protein